MMESVFLLYMICPLVLYIVILLFCLSSMRMPVGVL